MNGPPTVGVSDEVFQEGWIRTRIADSLRKVPDITDFSQTKDLLNFLNGSFVARVNDLVDLVYDPDESGYAV